MLCIIRTSFTISLLDSPNGGATLFPISLVSRDPARPAVGLGSAEYISQVTTSSNGFFGVLTSTNRYLSQRLKLTRQHLLWTFEPKECNRNDIWVGPFCVYGHFYHLR